MRLRPTLIKMGDLLEASHIIETPAENQLDGRVPSHITRNTDAQSHLK